MTAAASHLKRKMEPWPSWPTFAPEERAAADAVLASGKVNYWTGEECREFEREFCEYLGIRRSIALMNGTVALDLALRMWGIGAGDEVIVTPRSFIASTSCVVLLGARPIFADVDRNSGNITAQSIARVLTPRTRAIIPVHIGGWPCEMQDIMTLANQRDILVLEDCAQAHGARYQGKAAGSIGHAAAFSFCQDKILTTAGEGGLLASNDEALWERAWSYKDHGKTWEAVYERAHGPGFRWVHDRFGTNWRMTEIQGAIGRVQLAKLDKWVAARRANAARYVQRLASLPVLRIPEVPQDCAPAYYKFYLYLRPTLLKAGWTRDRIVQAITEAGVPCFAGSCSEIYCEGAFRDSGFVPAEPLPVAAELGQTSLMLLVHPTLDRDHVDLACDIIEEVILKATA